MPIIVFVSLRATTFFDSKSHGTLSAYHSRTFTIFPPRTDKVISKRLEYSLDLISNGKVPGIESGNIHLTDTAKYLSIVKKSFDSNDDLKEFIENMSGGNIRYTENIYWKWSCRHD